MKQKDQLATFQAKQEVIAKRKANLKADNKLVLIASAIAIVLAVSGQFAYFGLGPGSVVAESASPEPSSSETASENSDQVPSPELSENRIWTGSLNINGSPLEFELDGTLAPQAVANFVSLAQQGFYEGNTCHRLTTKDYGIEVLQCGDPKGDGTGGPGYDWGPIENAPADDLYKEGVLAMARQGDAGSSMGSQFFIVYADSTIPSDSAGGYTVFGKVTSGLELVKAIAEKGTEDGSGNGRPLEPVTLTALAVE